MGGKGYTLLLDLSELCKRENLKSAAVGQDRTVPAREPVESAKLLNKLITRANMEMIGVAKLNLGMNVLEVICVKRTLYRSAGCDILKGRRFDRSVNRFKFTETCRSALLYNFEFCHFPSP